MAVDGSQNTYLLYIDTNDTQTTSKSNILKAERKKAPSCKMHP